jgi:putative isomerase
MFWRGLNDVEFHSPYLDLLKNFINLRDVPFTERGSRLLIFRDDDHFSFRLAERWYKRDRQLSAYRRRPPIIDEWTFTNSDGQPLKFSLVTRPDRLDVITSIGTFVITFLDQEVIMIMLPGGDFGIRFRANLDVAQTDRRGGILRLSGDIRRNVAYTTDAILIRNETTCLSPETQIIDLGLKSHSGAIFLVNITPRLGFMRSIPDPQVVLNAAAQRWHDWFSAVPPVLDQYRQKYYFAWWVMGAGLISPRYYTTREAMTPSKFHYVGVWQWDAYFHALAYRYVDKRLAQDQLRILLDHQREDGMLPDAVHDEGIVTHLDFPVEADVTKPPLLAWAAWKLYEVDHDRDFLDEIYDPIVRSNQWWIEKNDLDNNGLCEYRHPFSSGLDDNPLWDDGMPVESPDLNTYLCVQEDTLAKIAQVIGEEDQARMWKERAAKLAQRMIAEMWDDKVGLFWARKDKRQIQTRTPFSIFPFMTGRLPVQMTDRLIAHLTDENQFWPRYPVPSVALNDPKYDPQQMWRGPTWVNINYLIIEGLLKTGYHKIAQDLRDRTLDLIGNHKDIYEYYHPQTGEIPPKAAAIFGWSSAVFIDLAIQASNSNLLKHDKDV